MQKMATNSKFEVTKHFERNERICNNSWTVGIKKSSLKQKLFWDSTVKINTYS